MHNPRIPLYALVALYLPGFSALAWLQGNREFLFYALTMLLIIAGVYALDRRVRFPLRVLWLLAIWGLAHMAGGTVPAPTADDAGVLYAWRPFDALPKYDQLVHAYGFFAATFAAAHCLRAAAPPDAPLRIGAGLAIALALVGMGLGALNEVVEFAATRLFEETGVGGYVNTGWDLVANTLGAGLAAAIIYGGERRAGASTPASPA